MTSNQMGSGMLVELRELLKSNVALDPDVVSRLTLSALANIQDQMQQHMTQHQQDDKCTSDAIGDLSTSVEALQNEVKNLRTELMLMTNNPVVSFGKHISEHPKMKYVYLITTFLFFNIWFVPGVRVAFLTLLGVPANVIVLFSH